MTAATNNSGYGNPGMGAPPWGPGPNANMPWGTPQGAPYGTPHGIPPWEHPEWGYRQWLYASKPLWIVATVLGFIFFWPLGLLLLFLMIGARRMGCFGFGRYGGCNGGWQGGWQSGGAPWANWRGFWGGGGGTGQAQTAAPASGNRAFDEYRAETLRRLEEEQKEFGAFLDRLRFAKDKAEFDQFMAELRQRPPAAPDRPAEPHAPV